MKCPACNESLQLFQAGEVELDACSDGCGGVWFDAGELSSFDEQHELSTHEILSLAKQKEGMKPPTGQQRDCPRCDTEVLVRQFIDTNHEIEIDQCWGCGGVWFDLGEINQLRDQFQTYEDRAASVNAYLDDTLAKNEQSLEAEVKAQVDRYNEETKNRFQAAKRVVRRLLGLDDLTDGL